MHDVLPTGSLQHFCFGQNVHQMGSQMDINFRIESACIAAIINNVGDFLFQSRPDWCHSRVILVIYEIVGRKEQEA